MILKGEGGSITNLTTAASIWFAAAIGISIGYSWYGVAILGHLGPTHSAYFKIESWG